MTPSDNKRGLPGKLLAAMIVPLAATVCLIGGGCASEGCLENQSALPLAEFYSYETEAKFSIDSLEIKGLDSPGDTVLVGAGQKNVSKVYLPMRPTKQTVTWQLIYRAKALEELGLMDEITIDYSSEPYFASEACGAFYNYRIISLRHTSVLLDSIHITDSLITNIDRVSFKLYFRTGEPEKGAAK